LGVAGEQAESLRIGLARAYREAGSLDAALRQLRMVLAQRRNRLGAVHADTLALRHRLGQWQREADRSTEAVETLRTAYRDALSAAGDPEIRLLALRIRRDLARAYRGAGLEGAPADLR
jgi:ATP/maltotriose-dependent transcriptional regulator MalT